MKPPPSDQWMEWLSPCVNFIHEDWGGCMVGDFFVSVGLCKKEITKKYLDMNLGEFC